MSDCLLLLMGWVEIAMYYRVFSVILFSERYRVYNVLGRNCIIHCADYCQYDSVIIDSEV